MPWRHLLRLATSILLIANAGCGGSGPDVLELTPPAELDEMVPAVREQYRSRRAALDSALQDRSTTPEELAAAFGQLGLWYHTYHLGNGAEVAYGNAIRLAPLDHRWPYYRGLISAAVGKTREARGHFENVLLLRPHDVPSLVRLAELELEAGDLSRAEELLERALSRDPDCVRAMVVQARVAEAVDDKDGALGFLQRAVAAQGDSSQVRYALALAYRRLGEHDRAAAHLALTDPQAVPDDARMRDPLAEQLRTLDVGLQGNVRRAREASEQGRHEVASRYFLRAVAADPSSVTARLGAARSLAQLGRFEQAAEVITDALDVLGSNPQLNSALGALLEREGRSEEAQRHFEAALAVQPSFRPALRGLGDLRVTEGDLEGALSLYQQARSENLTVELAQRHARVLLRLGRYRAARQSLESDLQALASSRELTLILARLLATAPDSAVRDGNRGLHLARAAFDAEPGLAAAEIVVMALAETGELRSAAAAQRLLIEAVTRAGRQDLRSRLERHLSLFAEGKPCRDPLPVTDSASAIFVDPTALESHLPPSR